METNTAATVLHSLFLVLGDEFVAITAYPRDRMVSASLSHGRANVLLDWEAYGPSVVEFAWALDEEEEVTVTRDRVEKEVAS